MSAQRLRHLNGAGYLESAGSARLLPQSAGKRVVSPMQTVASRPVRVLLVGGGSVGNWPFAERLEQSGYHCECVATCLDAAHLMADGLFDLALCSVRMKGFELLRSAVSHSSTSLFRYVLVEDGCWWLPTVLRGESCLNAPAFRGTEFAGALDTMIKRARFACPRAHAAGADTENRSDGTGSQQLTPESLKAF